MISVCDYKRVRLPRLYERYNTRNMFQQVGDIEMLTNDGKAF